MDESGRKITKIAREAGKFTLKMMKEEGIGTAEFDFIHFIRHNPGVTQAKVREQLKIDKGVSRKACGQFREQRISLPETEPGGWKKPAFVCDRESGTVKKFKGVH